MTRNERFIKRWEKTRQDGKKRYVLTDGMSMGAAAFLGYLIARLAGGNSFDQFAGYNVYMPLFFLIGGFIGGTAGASIRWHWNERRYNKIKSRAR
ncbi:MAG: hypothetical protein VB106_19265 [Clostridiaceae bacterium]|jgi:hypothetical protein|nr:hypothetical protein [Clostridiaceae bacterium]